MFILDTMLKRLIKKGALTIIDPDGRTHAYGPGGGFVSAIRIKDKATAWKLLTNPELEVGEAFMDGRVAIESGDVYDMVALFMQNIGWSTDIGPLSRFAAFGRKLSRRLAQYNPAGKSKNNVAHHYDLKDELFDLFLDSDRQYSCAYFPDLDVTLEEAQAYKKRHIAAKLLLEPGVTVLDIGSGWGGMGLYIANVTKANVTGITLSEEQHKVSNARARAAGIADRVRFELVDYRHESRRYDRIVSVGMFEHVGVNHFDAYFRKIADMLTEKGVALIHAIGRSDGPGATNPWIQKYIFPGGYSPALSEVLPAIERAGLIVTDVEILRLHYAETLRHWRERFNNNRDQIRALYDDRFCRMWELYLASSEATFRWGGHMVFQIQVAKSLGTVPLTRDYIGEAERRLPLDLTPVPAPARQAAE
ncbi:SAM-dependent methyltransferase [Labrys monachus]|uniref:Cyclopropane-fatty-acyl-phospholipid synthase n=1 Tax=Labrys monachus TaxID=217067 RepID=A0ABU0FE21_9HYPH|nr:cyclopropane-fatty-acyl-phospholipid synthase family protein [Labrys monachus]MDQ0392552.1 cyclopropane-fatty-acyl-phospholipid synthase [Labrys monachus]